MSLTKGSKIVFLVSLGSAVWGGSLIGQFAPEQGASLPPAAEKTGTKDGYQRSAEIYEMKTTAKDGPQRGEEIYYYKCWYCHNKYAKTAPLLKDLYKRPTLLPSGEPVNDRTVAAKIRNGGPAMPGYRYALQDADIADLLSYFREGKCCFEGDAPPANPRYRGTPGMPTRGVQDRRVLKGMGARISNFSGREERKPP